MQMRRVSPWIGPCRGRLALILLLMPCIVVCVLGQSRPPKRAASFTGSPNAGMTAPFLEAVLYNTTVNEVSWRSADKLAASTRKIEGRIALCGNERPDAAACWAAASF